MKKIFQIFIYTLLSLTLISCKEETLQDTYNMRINEKQFQVDLAISPEKKARGLMFRDSIDEDYAMLFVYDTPQQASFWMKNTYISLDIAFIDKDGVITQIRRMYPQNVDSVKSDRGDIMYCMEVNAGWFERNNIKISDKLDMQMLKEALKNEAKR